MVENYFCDLELLWSDLRNGEEEALFSLYKKLFNPLFNYGFSLSAAREDVEDAISQVFLELWEKRNTLRPVSNVKSYLFTYLRRKIIHQKNIDARIIVPETDLYEQSIVDYIVQLQVEEERRVLIFNAINKLTVRQKQLIIYKFYDNLQCEEIAEITGLAPQTIYNNIHQALSSLKNELKVPLSVLMILLRV